MARNTDSRLFSAQTAEAPVTTNGMSTYRHLIVASGKQQAGYTTTDEHLLGEFVRNAVSRIVPPELSDFNYDRVSGGEVDATRLATLADTPPLMADQRLIHIDEAQKLSKEAQNALCERIDALARSGANDVGFLLVYTEAKYPPKPIRDRAGTHQTFGIMRPWEAEKWVISEVRRAHGRVIDKSAAALLVGAVSGAGNTTGIGAGPLLQEIAKLTAVVPEGPIREEAVRRISGTHEGTIRDLCDAFGAKDVAKAGAILDGLLVLTDWSGVRVTIRIAYHLLELLRLKAEQEGHRMGGRPPAEWELKKLRPQAARWSFEELDYALDELAETDIALKSGAEERTALYAYLLRAAQPNPITPRRHT